MGTLELEDGVCAPSEPLTGAERVREDKARTAVKNCQGHINALRIMLDTAWLDVQSEQGREALLGLNRALNALREWERKAP